MRLSMRENDAIKRRGKHEQYEAAANVKWHAALQQKIFYKLSVL